MIYTIGHSTHSVEKLLALLHQNSISAVADVRSIPYSRANPQFNRESLDLTLRTQGIRYVFLGEELGARTKDKTCYENGRVQYDLLAQTEAFRVGLERIKKGSKLFRLVLLCAEKDPIQCHRMLLISRCLIERGIPVSHILETGACESQEQATSRLLARFGIAELDLFRSRQASIIEAFKRQSELVAYQADSDPSIPEE